MASRIAREVRRIVVALLMLAGLAAAESATFAQPATAVADPPAMAYTAAYSGLTLVTGIFLVLLLFVAWRERQGRRRRRRNVLLPYERA
jgi:hypothetical protein